MYWKYFKYVIRHKWFVFVECLKRKGTLKYRLVMLILGIRHDLSKFLPSEFIPYARYFYGSYPKHSRISPGTITTYRGLYQEDIQKAFDYAWLLHIHRNPHHWQHWLLHKDDGGLKVLPMPIKYLAEMGCDWLGAGKAITGENNIAEWYSKNKDNIVVGEVQRKFLERYVIGMRDTSE